MKFAKRMESLPLEFYPNASMLRKLASEGVDVIKMGVGSPSFDTPTEIKESTKRALDQGFVHYDDPAGFKEFRNAISAKLARFNGIRADPDSEILVTPGLAGAAFASILALVERGDEVLSFDPSYGAHDKRVAFAGGRVSHASLSVDGRWSLTREAMEAAITPRTTAVLLVNPHNPLGRVFTRDELGGVATVAREHDLVVLSDETYEDFTYDGRRHVSFASLRGMRERTVTMFTFTKSFAMDGWRLGYAVGPEDAIAEMKKIETIAHTHVNVFIQKGAIEAVSRGETILRDMILEDARRRDLVVKRLNEIDDVVCDIPEGGLYAFPDFKSYGLSSEKLTSTFLSEAHVSTIAGTSFGRLGAGHVRFCFGADTYDRIEVGMDRIEAAMRSLRRTRSR